MPILALIVSLALGAFHAVRSAPLALDAATAAAQAPIPSGAEGDLIRYGRSLVTQTPKIGEYVGAQMSCSACHLDAGTKPHAGSLLGIYAKFPQWSKACEAIHHAARPACGMFLVQHERAAAGPI